MRKYLISIFIICVIFISGCTSGDSYDNTMFGYANSMPGGLDYVFEQRDSDDATYVERARRESVSVDILDSLMLSTAAEPVQTVQRKIVKNAEMRIEVDDVVLAYEIIIERLESDGGYESGKTLESWGDNTSIHAELKIPAINLDMFLREITLTGNVRSQNIYSADITDQYYDSQTRLETLEKTLAKYYEFLEKADNVGEQLQVSNYISDLTYQIESLKGSLGRWDFLVEYSNITLYLYETQEIIERREIEWSSLTFDDMGYLIKSGFVNTSSFIINMFQRLFIALIAGSPVIIPAGLIIFFIIRRAREKRRERMAAVRTEQMGESENDL